MSRAEDLFIELESWVRPEDLEFTNLSLSFGKRVREILKENDLLHQDLAKRTGKRVNELSRLLRSQHNLTLRNIAMINAALPEPAIKVTSTRPVRALPVTAPQAATNLEAMRKFLSGDQEDRTQDPDTSTVPDYPLGLVA